MIPMAKPENVTCPQCGGSMMPRMGAHGKFWGCQGYPNCRGTRDVMGNAQTRFESDTMRRHGDEEDTSPSERWRNRDRSRWRD